MQIKFKENNTVAKYSGEVNDFDYLLQNENIIVNFQNVYPDSIVQISLGGIVLTEDKDFVMYSEYIEILQRGSEYVHDNMTITIFKQQSYGMGL